MWIPKFITNWLVKRAKRTPYFHLGDSGNYMERYWLVPYAKKKMRDATGPKTGKKYWSCWGTGPVRFAHRPFAWLLQKMGIAVRIHVIKSSDSGRDMHDHPWSFITVLLSGSYIEETPQKIRVRFAGDVIFHCYTDYHRLDIPAHNNEQVVTLFITFRERQKWGFLVDGKKVLFEDYHG
jgi:hypothetical protein